MVDREKFIQKANLGVMAVSLGIAVLQPTPEISRVAGFTFMFSLATYLSLPPVIKVLDEEIRRLSK